MLSNPKAIWNWLLTAISYYRSWKVRYSLSKHPLKVERQCCGQWDTWRNRWRATGQISFAVKKRKVLISSALTPFYLLALNLDIMTGTVGAILRPNNRWKSNTFRRAKRNKEPGSFLTFWTAGPMPIIPLHWISYRRQTNPIFLGHYLLGFLKLKS